MAITRTPIIDDDGTGTTGTVIDSAWKTELYNQVDRLTTLAITLPASVYNDFAPAGGAGATVWLLNASNTPVDLTGILAEANGTQHLLINASGNAISFHTQHANSLAGNRLIGPGFGTYVLGVWAAAWILYSADNASWIVLKA